MIPLLILATLATMSVCGWVITLAETRRFWLFWRRVGRRAGWLFNGSEGVQNAYRKFDQWGDKSSALFSRDGKFWVKWMMRSTARLCRYYTGISVFKNKVFTLP